MCEKIKGTVKLERMSSSSISMTLRYDLYHSSHLSRIRRTSRSLPVWKLSRTTLVALSAGRILSGWSNTVKASSAISIRYRS